MVYASLPAANLGAGGGKKGFSAFCFSLVACSFYNVKTAKSVFSAFSGFIPFGIRGLSCTG